MKSFYFIVIFLIVSFNLKENYAGVATIIDDNLVILSEEEVNKISENDNKVNISGKWLVKEIVDADNCGRKKYTGFYTIFFKQDDHILTISYEGSHSFLSEFTGEIFGYEAEWKEMFNTNQGEWANKNNYIKILPDGNTFQGYSIKNYNGCIINSKIEGKRKN